MAAFPNVEFESHSLPVERTEGHHNYLFFELDHLSGSAIYVVILMNGSRKSMRQVVLPNDLPSSDSMGEFHFGLGCQSRAAPQLVKVRNAKSE